MLKSKGERHKIPLLSAKESAHLFPFAEAYTFIRMQLRLMRANRDVTTLLVTSPGIQDGKSTTAANLAISMAQGGIQTWLVNCDLRAGVSLDEAFGSRNGAGLTTVLAGLVSLDDALVSTEVDELKYLPAGPPVPSPADLLSSRELEQFLEGAKTRVSAVVLDAPPTSLADALVLSTRADGVILVVRPEHTARDSAQAAVNRLKRVGANLLGVVLNNVAARRRSEDYGGHHHRGRVIAFRFLQALQPGNADISAEH